MNAARPSDGPAAEHAGTPAGEAPGAAPLPSADADAQGDAAALALQALQQRGAAQAEPVAWAHLQALAKRRAGHRGPARCWLDARLASAAAALAQRLDGGTPALPATAQAAPSAAQPGPLASLVALLNGTPALNWPEAAAAGFAPLEGPATPALAVSASGSAGQVAAATSGSARPAAPACPVQRPPVVVPPPLQPAGLPALKSLQRFKGTWARLSAEQRLARSQAQVPQGSGPLNSQWLVQRALQRLQALSPAYLQHFVAHADALLWLQQAASPAPTAVQVLRAEGAAAPAKRKPRSKARPGPQPASAAAPEPSDGVAPGDPGAAGV